MKFRIGKVRAYRRPRNNGWVVQWGRGEVEAAYNDYRRLGARVTFDGIDENITVVAHLFIVSLYFTVCADRVAWLPGVAWRGNYENGSREVSLVAHSGALWWRLWRNPDVGYSDDWRAGSMWFRRGK